MKFKDVINSLYKETRRKEKNWELEWLDELERDYKRRGLNKDFFTSESQYKNFVEKFKPVCKEQK